MLTSLLPGLRDLRAPLVAGYGWLLAAWLVFYDDFPGRQDASGLIVGLYELGEVGTTLGVTVALTAGAYLIGTLSQGIFQGIGGALWGKLRELRFRRHAEQDEWSYPRKVFATISRDRAVALTLLVSGKIRETEVSLRRAGATLADHPKYQQLSESLSRDAFWEFRRHDEVLSSVMLTRLVIDACKVHWISSPATRAIFSPNPTVFGVLRDEVIKATAAEITKELSLVRTRLIGKEPELFSQVDRLRAESEFRLAVAPPLTAIIILLTTISLYWSVGLAAVALLLAQGRRLNREANDLIVDAVVLGTISAPALETFSGAAREVIEERVTQEPRLPSDSPIDDRAT